mgnify:CR=1 FL=1|tara:strand:+ start:542 stop:901 length:360 start_codon:yes stop_codon:yes gene_type:complete
MKNLFFYFFILFIVTSCNYGVDFEIQNSTNSLLDSIILTNGFNNAKVFDLKPQKTKEIFLDFKVNNPNQDGLYGIQVFSNKVLRGQYFGYYSNGIPSSENYIIEIKKDTILVESENYNN